MKYTTPILIRFGRAIRVTLGSSGDGPDAGNELQP